MVCLALQAWPEQSYTVEAQGAEITVPIFGPKDYVRRTRKAHSVTDQFVVDNPDGLFVLRIENGGQGRQYPPTTSAEVILNGVVILSHDDFHRNPAHRPTGGSAALRWSAEAIDCDEYNHFGSPLSVIEKVVSLQKTNTLQVKLRGKPNSGFTLRILGGPANNRAPTADAGDDQRGEVGAQVQLDGSGSTDPDGDFLSYNWVLLSKPAASGASLSDPTAVKPTFLMDAPGTYTAQLIVNDGTASSQPDFVTITSLNVAPVADAGSDQTTTVGSTVTLDGSASSDADGDALTFKWTLINRPQGSAATIQNSTGVKPTMLVDAAGSYTARLVVNDGTADSAADTVLITTVNSPPVADAGPDQAAVVGEDVTLDGSGSHDVDGDALTFKWSLTTVPAGSGAHFQVATDVKPSFNVDLPGTYVAQLIVNDGSVDSLADTVTVSTLNVAPVANAGPDQTVALLATVTLDGSGSGDVNGDPLTFKWTLTSRPAGSQATLSNGAAVQPTFVADVPGNYVGQLIVNDGQADSLADTVTISTLNSAPVADAGPDQSVALGAQVTLDGSGSTDIDGNALTYFWTLTAVPAGSSAALDSQIVVKPKFTVDAPGNYVAQLIVNDGHVDSAADTVTISTLNSTPVANAGPDQTVLLGATVNLTGLGSSDADGDPLTFLWSLTTKPAGSTAVLSNTAVATPSFTADKAGTYVAQLKVNDGKVDSAADTVTISTENSKPVANAGIDQNVSAGAVVTLDGTGSSDADGDALTFAWSLTGKPAGSAAVLSNTTASKPTFTADLAGDYVAQLKVNDGKVDSNADTVLITAAAVVQPPIANAGTDQTVDRGATVQLDGSLSSDPNNGVLQFAWTLKTKPQGSAAALSNGNTATPTFVGDVDGIFVAELTVTKTGGLNDTDDVSVTVVAPTPVAVPNVVDKPQAQAELEIAAADLDLGQVSTIRTLLVAAGKVVTQVPVAGTLVPRGTPVNLVISLGPPLPRTVPNVVGLSQAAAQTAIAGAGLASGTIGNQNDLNVAAGLVLSQSPPAGTPRPDGSAVDFVVSLGRSANDIDGDSDGFTPNQGDCNDSNGAIRPNAVDTPGDGIDQNCNGADAVLGDSTAPVASIATPLEDAELALPTDIIGVATDANFLRYVLEYVNVDGGTFTRFALGSAPVQNGVLGQFDPTVLENGIYRVRLTVEDKNGTSAIAERLYRVVGEAKVGLMALSFVDLQVPVSGIPITVIRSYDNRVKTKRDFGVGWSLEIKTGKYQHNRIPGDGWTITKAPGPFGLPCKVVSEPRSHLTEIRLSDREFYLFRTSLTNVAAIFGGCVGTAGYTFVDGTLPGATLQVLGNTDIIYTSGETITEFDGTDDTGLIYHPRNLRLTTIDGRVFEFDQTGLTHLEDKNDNALNITPAGITHSSGKSITFERDQNGRITRITDPRGGQLIYTYDANGDLVVARDQAGNDTRFSYDAKHNLLDIYDPLGNRAFRGEYDANGRLIAITDAAGRRIEFSHDIDAREDIVIDARGNVTRITFDELGFVTSREGQVTIEGSPTPSISTFVNDRFGNQVVVVDPDGHRTEATYDHDKVLEEILDPNGLHLRSTWAYNAQGELLNQVDRAGNVFAMAYDGHGNPASYTDPLSQVTQLIFDDSGRPTSGRDPLGVEIRVTYDGAGNPVREERLDNVGTVLTRMDSTFDAAGNRLTMTEHRTVNGVARLLTSTYVYDARNRLTSVTDPLGGITRTEYNAIGLRSAQIDALGRRTSFTYDEVGALVRTDFPDGTSERLEYDASGNVVSKTDRAGLETTYEYDELKQPVRVHYPDGTETRTIYTPGGQVAASIDAAGNRTDHEYDAADRPVKTFSPSVVDANTGIASRPMTTREYDGLNRVTALIDPLGRRTELDYESFDRLSKVTYADGKFRQKAFDAVGRLIDETDEAGRVTHFDFSPRGDLRKVTNSAAGITTYDYDEAGNLLAQTDALGRITRFRYDELGRMVRRQRPSGVAESFEYDAVGNLARHTDFAGRLSVMAYDSMNRLLNRSLPDGSSQAFTYTPNGLRSSAIDSRGTTSYQYDAGSRATRIEQPNGDAVAYAYDTAGRLKTVTSPGASTGYAYDALNRIATVTSAEGVTSYGYDALGNIVRRVAPNGVVSASQVDARNRITQLAHLAGGQTLGSWQYEFSPTGRRTRAVEADGSVETYAYDSLDRLTGDVRTGTTPRNIAYQYDAVGNRTQMVRNGTPTNYAYDVDDQLLADSSTVYAYDLLGNLTSRTVGSNVTSYQYDTLSRLVATTTGGSTTTFAYDVDGNLVRRNGPDGDTHFLIDPLSLTGLPQVLEERNGAGGLIANYTYGHELLAMTRNSVARFYQRDGHGSIRLLTSQAGAVTDRYLYDSYGNAELSVGATVNPYRYVGERLDPTLGFYNLRARYYDPQVGRFIGRDPEPGNTSDPRSMHPYAYAHLDPQNLIDPTGRFTLGELNLGMVISDILDAIDKIKKYEKLCQLSGTLQTIGEACFLASFVLSAVAVADVIGAAGDLAVNGDTGNVILPQAGLVLARATKSRGFFRKAEIRLSVQPPGINVFGASFAGQGEVIAGLALSLATTNSGSVTSEIRVNYNLTNPANSGLGLGWNLPLPFLGQVGCMGLQITSFALAFRLLNVRPAQANPLQIPSVGIDATIIGVLKFQFPLLPPVRLPL